MTNLHLFTPPIPRSEFEQPSNSAPSYAEGGRSEVNRVTLSRRRGNLVRAIIRGRGFSRTAACVLFNRGRARAQGRRAGAGL